jgi:hypothetical protein
MCTVGITAMRFPFILVTFSFLSHRLAREYCVAGFIYHHYWFKDRATMGFIFEKGVLGDGFLTTPLL